MQSRTKKKDVWCKYYCILSIQYHKKRSTPLSSRLHNTSFCSGNELALLPPNGDGAKTGLKRTAQIKPAQPHPVLSPNRPCSSLREYFAKSLIFSTFKFEQTSAPSLPPKLRLKTVIDQYHASHFTISSLLRTDW